MKKSKSRIKTSVKDRSAVSEPNNLHNEYRTSLTSRYSSPQMSALFSERNRAQVWRDLWIFLAESEKELGLPITDAQVSGLKKAKGQIDFNRVSSIEAKLKHDVMSHLKAFAEVAPEAEPIIHLGATSAFITDNADAIILRDAVHLLIQKVVKLLEIMSALMKKYSRLEMTGFTHFQPAQPVTFGKRLALWAQDLVSDLEELEFLLARYRPLGCKGTTGTQASFMTLFKNDTKKVFKLDELVCQKMGFSEPVAVSGQTISRKADTWFLQALANLASSFSKMSYDLRLLAHLGEVREPFGKAQVGSSAMPYKQNPMLAERITGLARFVITLSFNGPLTHSTQWLERSLDDSSNRRLTIPEGFLATDALCEIAFRIFSGIRVEPSVIAERLKKYAPFFETEAEMMEQTLAGGSRQKLHEQIRKDMLGGKIKGQKKKSRANLSGVSAEQVSRFDSLVLKPILKKYSGKKTVKFAGADL